MMPPVCGLVLFCPDADPQKQSAAMCPFAESSRANMWPSYAPLSSHEDDLPYGDSSSGDVKHQQRQESSVRAYIVYVFLALVVILNLATFTKTLTMQADVLSAVTQARNIDNLPRPDPYVGLHLKHCEFTWAHTSLISRLKLLQDLEKRGGSGCGRESWVGSHVKQCV